MLRNWTTKLTPSKSLLAILLLGLVNGLTYVFLVPPWQHYDEPNHFEYVWLIANRPGLPKPAEFDKNMRLQVGASMLEHGFFRKLFNQPPKLEDVAASSFTFSQLNDPPLYYLLASFPVRLLNDQNVTLQLYAARLVSLCLCLIEILVSWGLMGELVSAKHPLRWMVPITLTLLPSFIDLMTAVNNDVGAVLVFTLFLWAGVRTIRRGLSFYGLVFVLGSAALCYWTANTAWMALPLIPVVLLFAALRGRRRLFAWVILLAAMWIGLGATFMWGDAAVWYRRTFQAGPTRVVNSLAPLGEHAFKLDLPLKKSSPVSIQQPIPLDTLRDLINKPITLGAWVWSTQPMQIQLPALSCECGGQLKVFTREIQTGTKPKFYSLAAQLPVNANYVWVALTTPENAEGKQGTIFYDGLILVKGAWISKDPPHFADINGDNGIWDGKSFTNLLRNSSAEQAGPGVHSWANKIGAKIMPAWPASLPSDALVSFLDWKGTGWYYQETFTFLLRTFWAKFGWDTVSLLAPYPYRTLLVITFLGMVGAGWAAWQRRHALSWEILFILGLAMFGIWLSAILRGIGSIFGWALTPVARYAYTAILPTILVLTTGWLEILHILGRWLRIPPKGQFAVYLVSFLALDVLAFVSITQYYYVR